MSADQINIREISRMAKNATSNEGVKLRILLQLMTQFQVMQAQLTNMSARLQGAEKDEKLLSKEALRIKLGIGKAEMENYLKVGTIINNPSLRTQTGRQKYLYSEVIARFKELGKKHIETINV